MLSSNQFTQLPYQEKKQTLIGIFSQIHEKTISFEDTIFLLNASNQIKETTLDKIYHDVSDLLQNTKNLSQKKYMERLKNIEARIQKDAEKESLEAESLLDTL